MRTIEGIVAKYNGIENIEGECLIVLNCEDNPLDDEIFPSFVLKGNYYFKSSQRVRIYYPTPIKIKEIDELGKNKFDAVIDFSGHLEVEESMRNPEKFYLNNFIC